jgi:cytochrome c oxidase subunit II
VSYRGGKREARALAKSGRFQRRPARDAGHCACSVHDGSMTFNRFLVCPRVILAGMLALTAPVLLAAPEPRVIEITARRFAFEPAEIEVAVGEPVRLIVRSADGVHGLEIKKLKVRKEIPRGGEAVTINFTAKEAGRFPILCSEYCGDDHDNMRGMLVVVAPGEGDSK